MATRKESDGLVICHTGHGEWLVLDEQAAARNDARGTFDEREPELIYSARSQGEARAARKRERDWRAGLR